jgi:hypothetical protein
MDNFTELVKRADSLFSDSIAIGRQLDQGIDVLHKNGEYSQEHIFVARTMLIDTVTLSQEMINSLRSQDLLLPLIGLRSLIETFINVAYIFAHPKHKNDNEWITNVCKDYVRRANDPSLMKQKLNEENIKNRAKEVSPDLEAQYNDAFVGLCNFTHMLGFTPTQVNLKKKEMGRHAAIVQTISILMNVLTILQRHFKLQDISEYRQKVIKFCDENAVDFSKDL